MNKLVFVEKDEVVTDSLIIAEVFGKNHDKVVRDIENQMAKLNDAGEGGWGVANFGATQYQHPQNKQWYPKYNLTADAFTIVVMSYTTPEAMKMKVRFLEEFKKMKDFIRKHNEAPPASGILDFERHLIGVKYTSEILRVDEVSKIRMLEAAHHQHGVPTNHLPDYVEEELKVSLTQLLRDKGISMSAARANTKLIELGLLEIKERPTSKGISKEFKSLTDRGQYYGSNAISTHNQKETQPMYYPSKAEELIQLLLGEG